MSTVIERPEWMTSTRCLGPAQVLDVDAAQGRARLRFAGSDDDIGTWAHVALPGTARLTCGDTVLAIGDQPDELYVIGLLNPKEATVATPARLSLSSGAYAEAARAHGDESLRVFSRNNELLFEYNEAQGKARINIERGNLEFVVRDGSIVFASGREILFHGQSVGISATSGIHLGSSDSVGKMQSALTLSARRVDLASGNLGISAGHASIDVEETRYEGKDFSGTLRHARLVASRIETVAESIVEKAKDVYRNVEQLTQLRTGRLRTLVESTFHFKARKAFLKSEQDFKIKAEKINLG